MRALLSAAACILIALVVLPAGTVAAADGAVPEVGFWEVDATTFSADAPIIIPNPVEGDTVAFYYAWPFRFENTVNLARVAQDLRQKVAAADTPMARKVYQRALEEIREDMETDRRRFSLSVSLHTDTGESQRALSLEGIRNMAERRVGRRLMTIQEINRRGFRQGETVEGVAIFPEPDPEADAFEVRVVGLGRRIVPAYYPGHLLKAGLPYEARQQKAMRFFYERPGDTSNRTVVRPRLETRETDWIWIWPAELYPSPSAPLVLRREVETDDGTVEIVHRFRYFPYEIYNSTAEERALSVVRVGFAPRLSWRGLEFGLILAEEIAEYGYRKRRAVQALRQKSPRLFASDDARVASGSIAPGEKLHGVALVEWGIRDPESVLDALVLQLRLAAVGADPAEAGDLLKAYLEIAPAHEGTKVWDRPAPPADETVRALILGKVAEDLQARNLSVDAAARRRYGELAGFAVLVNTLAEEAVEKRQGAGMMPLYVEADVGGSREEIKLVRLTNLDAPEAKPLDLALTDLPELPDLDTGKTPTAPTRRAPDVSGAADAEIW